jgi:uncharacterized membrane protein YdbT with pleckstrin-like domain
MEQKKRLLTITFLVFLILNAILTTPIKNNLMPQNISFFKSYLMIMIFEIFLGALIIYIISGTIKLFRK